MRHQRQVARLAGLGPRRFAAEDEVLEGDLAGPCGGGACRRVLPGDGPCGEVRAEEGDKVLLNFGLPWGSRDAGDEDGGEERVGRRVDVEVGGGGVRHEAEEGVGEVLVGRDEGE